MQIKTKSEFNACAFEMKAEALPFSGHFDKKNNKRHLLERLSVTLQRENGSMLLERSPLPAADVDGEM